jgi:hypothetical protein
MTWLETAASESHIRISKHFRLCRTAREDIFLFQMVFAIRHKEMTYDEEFHKGAGVWDWKSSDFGVNSAHLPFPKLFAEFP